MAKSGNGMTFGFTAAAVAGTPEEGDDATRYRRMLDECKVAMDLGYETAWVLEHHFTDYFPTPSPVVLMAHLAAAFPRLNLGTCVIVAPWYNPVRLAEEIAMLSHLCGNHLHLAFGRGTAKLEYDAYDIDMSEARGRYAEIMAILHKALSGEEFDHDGDYYKVGRRVALRPKPNRERIHLYGAVGSIESAPLNADMGLPILCNTQFPPRFLEQILTAWRARADELELDVTDRPPISANCLVAESDEEARDLARDHLSTFFALQAAHYEADADHWKDIEGYQQFSRAFANLKKLADPANLDKFIDFQLIGAADTVRGRLEALRDMGFGHVIVNCSREGVPHEVRHETLRRFAQDVAPGFR